MKRDSALLGTAAYVLFTVVMNCDGPMAKNISNAQKMTVLRMMAAPQLMLRFSVSANLTSGTLVNVFSKPSLV